MLTKVLLIVSLLVAVSGTAYALDIHKLIRFYHSGQGNSVVIDTGFTG